MYNVREEKSRCRLGFEAKDIYIDMFYKLVNNQNV